MKGEQMSKKIKFCEYMSIIFEGIGVIGMLSIISGIDNNPISVTIIGIMLCIITAYASAMVDVYREKLIKKQKYAKARFRKLYRECEYN